MRKFIMLAALGAGLTLAATTDAEANHRYRGWSGGWYGSHYPSSGYGGYYSPRYYGYSSYYSPRYDGGYGHHYSPRYYGHSSYYSPRYYGHYHHGHHHHRHHGHYGHHHGRGFSLHLGGGRGGFSIGF